MTSPDFDNAVKQYQEDLVMFLKGNPEPVKRLWSHKEDVSLLNPFGTLNKGWRQVSKTLDQVSSQVREGEIIFETLLTYVTSNFAFIVEVEKSRAKIGKREEFTDYDLRVTTIFRHEDGGWKILHRHADQMVSRSVQPVESLMKKSI